jgi:isocitrate dehydrogenase
MTKDLAICIYGNEVKEDKFLYTEPFIDLIAQNLRNKIIAKK